MSLETIGDVIFLLIGLFFIVKFKDFGKKAVENKKKDRWRSIFPKSAWGIGVLVLGFLLAYHGFSELLKDMTPYKKSTIPIIFFGLFMTIFFRQMGKNTYEFRKSFNQNLPLPKNMKEFNKGDLLNIQHGFLFIGLFFTILGLIGLFS
jgi:high-affinity Fe2+/Pb2+ permease